MYPPVSGLAGQSVVGVAAAGVVEPGGLQEHAAGHVTRQAAGTQLETVGAQDTCTGDTALWATRGVMCVIS